MLQIGRGGYFQRVFGIGDNVTSGIFGLGGTVVRSCNDYLRS
jgi:hypothetical protein